MKKSDFAFQKKMKSDFVNANTDLLTCVSY